VIERRLAQLPERVEQIRQLAKLAPFSRELERTDDDSRVRRRIAARIDRAEATRCDVAANVKPTEAVGPMRG
jgi:hypothetical protein